MAHEEEMRRSTSSGHPGEHKDVITSKKVSDHLANERTFLAWLRTGLATITFGFVIERFGLALREMGLKTQVDIPSPVPFSAIIGISLTLLGLVMIGVAELSPYSRCHRHRNISSTRPLRRCPQHTGEPDRPLASGVFSARSVT